MQVSYRGTITEKTTASYRHSYSFSDNKQQASIKLELSPNERGMKERRERERTRRRERNRLESKRLINKNA
jgi:translation elongation factor EF-G